jgi:hypothetical protein
MPEKQNPGTDKAPGHEKNQLTKSTTMWLFRQAVKITLPYIAAIITSTRYTARKSCFLDRLIVMAEGGSDDLF